MAMVTMEMARVHENFARYYGTACSCFGYQSARNVCGSKNHRLNLFNQPQGVLRAEPTSIKVIASYYATTCCYWSTSEIPKNHGRVGTLNF
jgi:hypothetical protein